jgi:serine/threonine protein phosphatase 1
MIFRRGKRKRIVPEYPLLRFGQVIYAIGDIHGRRDLLDELHRLVDRDRQRRGGDALEVYLGDYIDRGSDSAGVISRLVGRSRRTAMICLEGNHEVLLEEFLGGKLDLQTWSRFGGLETLRSYGVDPDAIKALTPQARADMVRALVPADHFAFLGSLQSSYETCGYFFTHAGVRPGIALAQQKPSDLRTIRGAFLEDERDHGAIIVHGHTPCEQPEVFSNRINIDTGAYITNRLTCLVIDHLGPRFLDQDFQ